MNDSDGFKKYARLQHERPNNSFRCGRAVLWGKPCPNGPKPDGSCGGTSECEPVKRDNRFECRRPANVSGPCTRGPNPDGTCSHSHPPCVPRPTLLMYRCRFTAIALGVVIASIAALSQLHGRAGGSLLAVDPGPLSAKHANFIGQKNCVACHKPHELNAAGWMKAAFQPHDLTTSCTQCHRFGGPENKPHNTVFAQHAGLADTSCQDCHREHRGAANAITHISDAQCNACHRIQFHSFSRGHPAFSANFPRVSRATIKFDHTSHLKKHFADAKFAPRAPKDCAGCHSIATGDRMARTAGFDQACAACHADQIPQNDLVVLRIPEPGPDAEKNIAPDDATAAMNFLLHTSGMDEKAYREQVAQFIGNLAKSGADALAAKFKGKPGQQFVAGLNPEVVSVPARAWVAKQSYEPPAKAPASGWYWSKDLLLELRYKPAGHADPLVQTWMANASDSAAVAKDPEAAKRAAALQGELLNATEGVGRCAKCHDASGAVARQVAWHYHGGNPRSHTVFNHSAHAGLLDCTRCHDLNTKADFAVQFKKPDTKEGVTNFASVKKDTCTQCHAEKKVRQDCQLCHRYHNEPTLKQQRWAGK